MAESASILEEYQEEPLSPDIFAEYDNVPFSPETPNRDEETDVSTTEVAEPEPAADVPEWKGVTMDEIYKGLGPFGYQQLPPIRPSEHHTVLFQLPVTNRGPPKPYPSQPIDKWHVDFVRMPNSPHCLYPIQEENKPKEFKVRWEVIQLALLQNFVSVAQLEAAILSYNNKYASRWNFSALHHFFTEVMDEDEVNIFFEKLLPKIVQLALQLPTLITGPIPLLKQHKNASISLSQLQVASLMANAFFCTFPRRNTGNPTSEYSSYPYINFNGLFSAFEEHRPNRSAAVTEKLKCLFHYFRRVTTSAPEGTITIQRRYIPKKDCPMWNRINEQLPPLHITSKGTIEDEGAGLLQVDFANKFVGGGVLYWGCVQEEIRFIICPELIVTMLVTEVLDDTEALLISGVERYSNYEGYGTSFKWSGNFVDETPRDNSGRRKTTIVAIDALFFTQENTQFKMKNVIRELNKAYVGFSSSEMPTSDLSAIATGNWGCGAFRGNPKLKVLIQLMAAAAAGRPIVYFTFGDKNLRDSVAEMYWHLINHNVDVARLFGLLRAYETEPTTSYSDFYRFLYNRAKIKPLTSYFSISPKKKEKYDPLNVAKMPSKKITWQSTQHKDSDATPKLQKFNLSYEPEQEEKARKLPQEDQECVNGVSKENKKNNEISPKKKKSLWEIFAEKESVQDREAVQSDEKNLTGLELLGSKTTIVSDAMDVEDTDDVSENAERISPKKVEDQSNKDVETINNTDNDDKNTVVPKTSTKLINEDTNLNEENKEHVNSPINSPKKTPTKPKGCQKKIIDFFSPKK